MAAYRANLATSLFPGLIGFLCTVIIDTILAVPFVQPRPSLRTFNFRLKFTLRAIVPHYCLARYQPFPMQIPCLSSRCP